ncbi:sigma-70 family RNA polymerase sigma factor [Hamadaea tsunoensis]|uniref:sigma-70 family RNA polymerase sigma factor n=1 Tax=Hamadaea tsunoensis TaxID=53368 RepID=UPI00040D8900|nr:sigma-70 family RNA polymerase sigma factor [Hamadaea tsunoensis]
MQATEAFEAQRPRLRAVAYRMLGSLAEADDAVQETWLRLHRTQESESGEPIENLGGWLTTVTARVCLNVLRSRGHRREEPYDPYSSDVDGSTPHIPDPIVSPDTGLDPEHEALLADSVGLALLVVLDTLTPAERVAFVLHDLFAVSFDEIAPLLDRTPATTRQLASRARRRVQGQDPMPDPDLARQRAVVDAFFAASREGDLDGLIAVLDPDVVLRSDGGTSRPRLNIVLRGPQAVSQQAYASGRLSAYMHRALINGTPGAVVIANGKPMFVMAFTVRGGRIVAMDILADVDRLEALDLSAVAG